MLMDFDSLREQQSGLGTAAIMVMDKSTDIVAAIARLSSFYKHEVVAMYAVSGRDGLMSRMMSRMVTGDTVEEVICSNR